MIYRLKFTPEAMEDLARWKRSGRKKVLKKIMVLLEELSEHPQTGMGHPEELKGDRSGQWSRTLDKKNRLVYIIQDDEVMIVVLSMMGHYSDK